MNETAALAKSIGDAIKSVADALARVVSLGSGAYDEVVARRTEARLRSMHSRFQRFTYRMNASTQRSFKEWRADLSDAIRVHSAWQHESDAAREAAYAAYYGNTPERFRLAPDAFDRGIEGEWNRLQKHLGEVMHELDEMLTDLENENSDLTLDPVYGALLANLHGRKALIGQLGDLGMPRYEAEYAAFEQMADAYEALIDEMRKAITTFGAVLSADKAPQSGA